MYIHNYGGASWPKKQGQDIVTFVTEYTKYLNIDRHLRALRAALLLLLLVPPPPLALPITKDARNNALRSTFTVTKNDLTVDQALYSHRHHRFSKFHVKVAFFFDLSTLKVKNR